MCHVCLTVGGDWSVKFVWPNVLCCLNDGKQNEISIWEVMFSMDLGWSCCVMLGGDSDIVNDCRRRLVSIYHSGHGIYMESMVLFQ